MYSADDESAEGTLPGQDGSDGFSAGSPENPVPLGKYLLLGRLARGGMAEIYRARAASGIPPHLLVIKRMRHSLAKESRFVEMFIREGKLAVLLDHPGIVRTFEVGAVDGQYFIVMEHIFGKDLNQVLKRCQETGRRVPIPHSLFIGSKVCRALAYAHSLKGSLERPLSIVNRDVSPSNIRVSYEGEVKLLDFGIAQAVLQVTSEIGVLKGKFSYMSPEQIRGMPVDRRTDIFSLGIVLHEMLTCTRLFREESEFVLMEMVRRADVKPPSAFNPRVPPQLDAIVMKALARNPADRYADAESMADDLEQQLKAYSFSIEELSELVQGLFRHDYGHDLEIERACLSASGGSPPEGERTIRRKRARRRAPERRRRPRPTHPPGAPKSESALWIAAIALLVAGMVLFVLAMI